MRSARCTRRLRPGGAAGAGRAAPGRFVGFDHVERLLELARDPRGAGSAEPAGAGRRHAGDRRLCSAPAACRSHSRTLSRFAVYTRRGRPRRPGLGSICHPSPRTLNRDSHRCQPPGQSLGQSRLSVPASEQPVAADGLRLPLAVRSRQPGDRFRPLGMGGREKKLQDFLVDRKVAREERDSLPLVVDGADRIVWVVGSRWPRIFGSRSLHKA